MPKISLGIDNCFASKRWTRPEEWTKLIHEMDLRLIEASADTECDPLYMGSHYMNTWVEQVKTACEKNNVIVANLYSGHGTYSTLGLAHTDRSVRQFFKDNWIKSQADTAKKLDAGLGFFAHGINYDLLQNKTAFQKTMETLYEDLADIAAYAQKIELHHISLEQMYSPHQPPWTISSCMELMDNVFNVGNAPLYITLDVGHMNGQKQFFKPSEKNLEDYIIAMRVNEKKQRIWLGTKKAVEIIELAANKKISIKVAISEILKSWEGYDYLFAKEADSSVYQWVERFGSYSPIIHLQQSDGRSSPHWNFTEENNKKGIIKAPEFFRALTASYRNNENFSFEKCDKILLTLEPFIATAGNNYTAIEEIKESIRYWRQYIPRDYMPLDEIMRLPLISDALCK